MKFVLALFTLGLLQVGLFHPAGEEESVINRLPSNHVPHWDIRLSETGQVHLIDSNEILPSPQAESLFEPRTDVGFHLYTRSNRASKQDLKLNDLNSITRSNFVASKPTRFIIHGWNNHGGSPVNTLIKDAYLSKADVNVIVVDWGLGANHLVYSVCRDRIDAVAAIIAEFIDFLADKAGAPVSNVIVVGHSLGGHTAGLVGKKVRKGKLPRVVALDPAGPLFSMGNPGGRVDKADATFVEVIHTNTGTLGFTEPLGHADFYPSYGKSQPGCGSDPSGSCSHGRAYEFFAESLTSSKGFTGRRCSSYSEINGGTCSNLGTVKMGGEPLSTKTNGVYHVSVNDNAPFAQG